MDLSACIIHSHRGVCLLPIQAQARPPDAENRVDPKAGPSAAARPTPPWRNPLPGPPNTPPPGTPTTDPPPPGPPTTDPPPKATPPPGPPTTPPPGLPAASAPRATEPASSSGMDDALRSRQDELPSDEVLRLVQVRSSLSLELMGKRSGKKTDCNCNWI